MANALTNLLRSGALVPGTSMGATFTSKVLDITSSWVVGLEFFASSADSHVGTITVEISNSGDNWVTATFADGTTSISAAASTELKQFRDMYGLGARYMRIVYTRTSGTGSLYVYHCEKAGTH